MYFGVGYGIFGALSLIGFMELIYLLCRKAILRKVSMFSSNLRGGPRVSMAFYTIKVLITTEKVS